MPEISNNDVHLWWTVVVCVCIWLVWPLIKRRVQWLATFNKLPGPTLIQTIKFHWKVLFTKDLMGAIQLFRETVTPFVYTSTLARMWVGHYPCVGLFDVEAVKTLLNSQTEIEKAKLYKYARNVLSDGLLTSNGSKWQQRRKLLTPAFHFRILEDFQLVMNEQAAILVQLLHQKCEETKCGEFDICPFINRCALDILCETAMGQGVNAQMNHECEFVKAMNSVEETVALRVFNPLLYFDWIHRMTSLGRRERCLINITHGFNNNIIKTKRQKLAESKQSGLTRADGSGHVLGVKRRVALLDLLLEKSMEDSMSHGQPLTDDDIREEVYTFMQVGQSTTSIVISGVFFYVGLHQHIQQKIVDEIDEVYRDSEIQNISIDLHKLKYLDCVIKETLRLCPSAPLFARHLNKEMNICGYTIPSGVTVAVFPHWIHRDPAYFPQPHIFDPDRFLPENSQGRDPFVYIPFSAGPRNCIGQRYAMMKAKVVVAAVLRRFKLAVVEPDVMAQLIDNGIPKPLHGLRVRLEPRSN